MKEEQHKQVLEIQKLLGSVGYILNNWDITVKGTKYDKFGVKYRANALIKEFKR